MKSTRCIALTGLTLTLALALPAGAHQADAVPGAIDCGSCAEWNQPQKPFNIYGNTWYVGTKELSALLVTSPQGHILLDGALPQSAPVIAANIAALGFKLKDVKLIVNSHEHFDHLGGIAALQQGSGAQVAASAIGARVLRDGVIGKDDAQYDPAEDPRVPKVTRVKEVGEGEQLRVGKLRITAHMTPGHAPGGTTWSWTSCEKGRCLDMVYADSLTAVSSDAFRFSDDPKRVAQFRETINKVGALKCDIVVSTHPGFTDIMEKHAQRKPGSNPFIDPAGCRNYAQSSMERLDKRLATEAAPAAPAAK